MIDHSPRPYKPGELRSRKDPFIRLGAFVKTQRNSFRQVKQAEYPLIEYLILLFLPRNQTGNNNCRLNTCIIHFFDGISLLFNRTSKGSRSHRSEEHTSELQSLIRTP